MVLVENVHKVDCNQILQIYNIKYNDDFLNFLEFNDAAGEVISRLKIMGYKEFSSIEGKLSVPQKYQEPFLKQL